VPTAASAETVQFLDSRARILASGEETGGTFGLVELSEIPAGSMPPLHVHHGHDEGFYVLEGEVTLFVPGADVTLRAGDFYLAPRGVPHTYRVGATDARWLATSSPAGFERFVAGVAALADPTPDRLGEVAGENDIEIRGPPGAMP
jgi:quercetin dioxygenase-like cupin family protein